MYLDICVRYPALLSNLTQIWSFSTDFHKSPKDPISMKVHPVGAVLIRVDGQRDRQADMGELIGAFSLYICRPKQQIWMAFKEITKQTRSSGHPTAQPNDHKKTVKPNTYNNQTDSIFCPLSVNFT